MLNDQLKKWMDDFSEIYKSKVPFPPYDCIFNSSLWYIHENKIYYKIGSIGSVLYFLVALDKVTDGKIPDYVKIELIYKARSLSNGEFIYKERPLSIDEIIRLRTSTFNGEKSIDELLNKFGDTIII